MKQAALTQLVDAALADDLSELPRHQEKTATTSEQNVGDDGNNGGDFGWEGFHANDGEGGAAETQPKAANSEQEALIEVEQGDLMEKTSMSQHEIDTALEQAKLRGLPSGWTVSWDVKRKRRVWVSPCGKHKCRGIVRELWIVLALK